MNNPAMKGGAAERIGGLSGAKRELLQRRLRGKSDASKADEIPPRPAGSAPMSFGQERLWFQLKISNNPALFNIAFLAHIDGPLDAATLETCINAVISRHEALRAGFEDEDGRPKQFFSTAARVAIDRVDLSREPQAAERMQTLARSAARAPFDLARPPLMRVALFRLSPTRHSLLFVVHHIVWDGWSSGVFIDEITRLYQARLAKEEAPLAPLATQYADFAHWHRALIAGPTGERQIDYWRKRLAGLPESLSLPTDRPRQLDRLSGGREFAWDISAETVSRIRVLEQRHNVTQFAVLLSAYNAFLMHYCGERDIAVGAAMAYRTRPALERLVGFFANMVTIRTSLENDPTFEELIVRTQQTSVEAQSNQDVPFDVLVEKLAPRRNLRHNPLFQVAFVQHHLPIEELRIGDLRINCENVETNAAVFDLVLHIYRQADGLKAIIEYNSHLFETRTIENFATHFDALLKDLLRTPDVPVSRASLFDAREREAALARSRVALPVEPRGLLQDVVANAAPADTAVACGTRRLTYGELAEHSNQLAHRLRRLGAAPDMPIAILMEPSVEVIVAILGVLKSDGAYVPLDPSYPGERIAGVLQDCGAQIVVTTHAHAAVLADTGLTVVLADSEEIYASEPASSVPPRTCADHLAYLIYTSGSTGLSKGVMVSHRNAVASTRARDAFYPERVSGFLLLSSISFDSSVAGIFWTLAQGGALHIATDAERRDPGELGRAITTAQISHLLCLPSLYGALLDFGGAERLASLRCCVVAGEACRNDIAETHLRMLPHAALVNEYGPTECAVWSTAQRIERVDPDRPVSIGAAIPGAQALVLGQGGALLPQGASGELCIGGAGLSRGYMGRPDLTADRFRPHPYGAPGERLYHSGDLARLNADDRLEFLGRLDVQVKVRGYRVDPREIESIMLQHPDIVDCVVVAQGSESGTTRLIAYVETTGSEGADLKRHASSRLPPFMTPDIFVRLEQMPRLPNGKVNRKGMPEPPTPEGAEAVEAEDASFVEILLADIWREVIGALRIAGSDNFFDLGGNSLSAMQVVARAQRILGFEVPVSLLFQAPDLRAFAQSVTEIGGPDLVRELESLLAQIDD